MNTNSSAKISTGFSSCNNMALKLSMTCGPYDRARALIDGKVKPQGIDLEVRVNKSPGRHTKIEGKEFDAAEFYTGTYIADLHYRTLGYTAIPIFVKRMFRHSYIYINKRAGIRSPSDLNGKRIGVQNWLTTTAVWARGLLEDEYGLDQKSGSWFTERMRGVGDWKAPAWLKLERIPEGRTQFDLLAAGDIDAGITTGTWAPNVHPDVDFLFPNYADLERDYQAHRFFPDHAYTADQNLGAGERSLGRDEHLQCLARVEKKMLPLARMAARAPNLSLVPRAMGGGASCRGSPYLPLG